MAQRKQARHHIESWEAKLGTSSFDPLTILELQDAVRNGRESVTLNDKEFLLKYSEDKRTVYYSPKEGFAPAGHLVIEQLLGG